MHIESKLTLIGAGSILLLDSVGSFLSVHFHFPYTLFFPACLAVYFGMTYWAAKCLNLRGTLTFGAFLGLIDATIGWKLSDWLGADPDRHLQKITFSAWCITAVWVIILGAVIAGIAFFIASGRNKRESR